MSVTIKKVVEITCVTGDWVFHYDEGDPEISVRIDQAYVGGFSLSDLAQIVALKKAIDDLA